MQPAPPPPSAAPERAVPGGSRVLRLLVDRAADGFEAEFRDGRRPSIETFAAAVPPAVRDEVVRELVGAEADLRRRAGEPVDAADYAGRFGDLLGVPLAAAEAVGLVRAVVSASTRPPAGLRTAPATPPRFARPLRINRSVGKNGLLGQGGIGQVWAVRDTRKHRDLAVKILHPRFAEEPDLVARFEREARIAAGFRDRRDPGVPLFYGYRPGDPARRRPALLVTELVRGVTFADLLPAADGTGGVSRQRRLTLFRKAVKVVARAHAGGIIHRDLKPPNLMAAAAVGAGLAAGRRFRPERAFVLDWGMARERVRPISPAADRPLPDLLAASASQTETVTSFAVAGDDTLPAVPAPRAPAGDGRTLLTKDTARHTVLGSAPYMAPEQALTLGADARTDVYSLGLILLEFLTGEPARPGGTTGELMDAARRGHTGAALERLEHCDAGARLVGLCTRCVQRRPADRPADAGVLLAELDRLSARHPASGERFWKLGDAAGVPR